MWIDLFVVTLMKSVSTAEAVVATVGTSANQFYENKPETSINSRIRLHM